MLDLPENLTIRAYRLEASYTASRLSALDETRELAKDFVEAADKLKLLEDEESRLALERIESQASVETADDAWDDTVHALEKKLLELSGHNTDAPLYRKHFAEIPSHVTNLSYNAEIMISKDIESALDAEEHDELRAYAEKLRAKREPLEAALTERTRLEVDEARFENRVALAKSILNKLRRQAHAQLENIGGMRGRTGDWSGRFFHTKNSLIEALDHDGASLISVRPTPNGESAVSQLAESGA